MNRSLAEQAGITESAKITRRALIKRATLGLGAAALGLAGYSGLIEPNEIDIKKLELKIERLAAAFDGFRIALISDFHFGPYTGEREIGAAVQAVNRLKVDAVVLLGDFVSEPLTGDNKKGAKKAEPCAKVLSALKSRLGSFAVLGNHDHSTDPEFVGDALTAHGISLLRNESSVIEQDRARLWLLGVDDVLAWRARLDEAVARVPSAETKVLLVHEPDFADYSSQYGIDAQFSGHSHGGQIRVPGLRPLWLPELARKYFDGYYRIRNLQLYTNRGVGTVNLPFRFLCPPEVTDVTLRSA